MLHFRNRSAESEIYLAATCKVSPEVADHRWAGLRSGPPSFIACEIRGTINAVTAPTTCKQCFALCQEHLRNFTKNGIYSDTRAMSPPWMSALTCSGHQEEIGIY